MDNPVYVQFNKELGQHYEFRPQKNGKTYVYLRPSHWDRRKGRMIPDKATLLGAAVPGEPNKLELIGKRRKEALAAQATQSSPEPDSAITKATITSIGAMDIINHMFDASGVDEDTVESLAISDPYSELKLAAKCQSTMRYMLRHKSAILDGLEISQIKYKYPYDGRLTETEIGRLYQQVGCDVTARMRFFQARLKRHGGTVFLAYDSTLIASYSERITRLRRTHEEINGKTQSLKLFVLYAIDTKSPIAWFDLPGSTPDVSSLEYAIHQMHAVGINDFEIVADSGFMSETNLAKLEECGIAYLIRNPNHRSAVRKAFDAHMDEFASADRVDSNAQVAGIKVILDNGRYLYLFKDQVENQIETAAFLQQLYRLKDIVKSDAWVRDKTDEDDLKLIDKYLVLPEAPSPEVLSAESGACTEVSFNRRAVDAYCSHLSTFALMSSQDMSPKEAFEVYFMREGIEDVYASLKGKFDDRTRVRSDVSWSGRMYIIFGALCALQYFQSCLTRTKDELRRFLLAHKDERGYIGQCNAYQSLLSWLENVSIKQILDWFDVYQEVAVESKSSAHRWSEPVLKRDQLFLAFVGLAEFPEGFKELPNFEWIPNHN